MGGRPRRSVPRVQANVTLEQESADELRAQADAAGLPLGTYVEQVVSQAHRYSGPYLEDLDTLPTSIPLARLRQATARLGTKQCTPVSRTSPALVIKLDKPLADQLRQRAAELHVYYTDYLRAVLRLAAGATTSGSGQLELGFDVSTAKGERRLRAS